MKKPSSQQMPLPVQRALKKFGINMRIARLKRGFTTQMMAERIGIHRSTYSKMEKGDPNVGWGIFATALFILGLGTSFGDIIDPKNDDTGLLLDFEKLPKRARPKKNPQAL